MKKKGLLILSAVVIAVAGMFGGCGKKEATENISVITASVEEGYTTKAIAEAANRYANENKLVAKVHQVTGGKKADIAAAVKKAAAAGTDIILCSGAAFEVPLYELQSEYKKIKFIILDGAPRKENEGAYKVRKNTQAILYRQEQGGFLAGYAAVKDGYKNLGFMGGAAGDSVVRYGVGFVQGANYAAKEMGLSKDKITIRYEYQGTNEISPALMEKAGKWYDDGCEVIFASGGSIGAAVMKAAEQRDKKVIGADADQAQESAAVITSAVKEISQTTYTSIASVYNKKFQGKKTEQLDVAGGGISLSMNSSQFAAFTEQDYRSMVEKLSSKDFTITIENIEKIAKKKDAAGSITLKIESAQ